MASCRSLGQVRRLVRVYRRIAHALAESRARLGILLHAPLERACLLLIRVVDQFADQPRRMHGAERDQPLRLLRMRHREIPRVQASAVLPDNRRPVLAEVLDDGADVVGNPGCRVVFVPGGLVAHVGAAGRHGDDAVLPGKHRDLVPVVVPRTGYAVHEDHERTLAGRVVHDLHTVGVDRPFGGVDRFTAPVGDRHLRVSKRWGNPEAWPLAITNTDSSLVSSW